MDVGYARIKKIDNTDPLNPVETYRYVDILIDNEADEVVEPYFFLYDYGQKERTLHYSVPLEGLNHTEVNQNTLEILGTQVPSVNKLLSYTNSIYFPQLHPSKFYIEEPITPFAWTPPDFGELEPDVLPIEPEVSSVATGSEDNSGGDSMGHIYIMLYEGEVSLQLFYRHNIFSDPHFVDNESGAIPMLDTEILLDKSDIPLRSIVLTLSVDREDINYSMAIFNDEVKTPVKWVVSPPKAIVRALPSINYIRELESSKIKLDEDNNLLLNKSIIGKLKPGFMDLESNILEDIEINVSDSFISINGNIISNDQPI
jgi:hypothetical protein